jgi:hypothetical protein
MTNYNQLPTELKDGSNQSVQQITNTTTSKELEKNENTPVEQVLDF